MTTVAEYCLTVQDYDYVFKEVKWQEPADLMRCLKVFVWRGVVKHLPAHYLKRVLDYFALQGDH
jgi:hypothetical protein